MSGAEVFSVRVVSPSAMSQSVPLELETGPRAVATVCWPEVGAHSVSVTLDGATPSRVSDVTSRAPRGHLPRGVPDPGRGDAQGGRGRARQLRRRGARRARATVSRGWRAARRRRALAGATTADGAVTQRADSRLRQRRVRGVIRHARRGPYEVALCAGYRGAGDEGRVRGGQSGGVRLHRSWVTPCSTEVGPRGASPSSAATPTATRAPSRQGQLALRCSADGPGTVDAHVVDGAEGRSDVVASPSRRADTSSPSSGGDDQARPGVSVRARRLPRRGRRRRLRDVGVRRAARLAGRATCSPRWRATRSPLTVAPRDAFGNQTVFGPGARVAVSAVGGPGASRRRSRTAAGRGPRRRRAARSTPRGRTSCPRRLATSPSPGTRASCRSCPARRTPGGACCSARRCTGVDCGQESP